MAIDYQSAAEAIADVIARVSDDIITPAQASAELTPTLEALIPVLSTAGLAGELIDMLGRIEGTIFTAGPPSNSVGRPNTLAIDLEASLAYLKDATEWGAPTPFGGGGSFLAAGDNGEARPISEIVGETISVNNYAEPAPGAKFSFAQAAAGENGAAIQVAPGIYDLSYSLGGLNTWLLTGPTEFTGAGATQGPPGKVIQLAGVKNPGGDEAFADPMYVGPWNKSWVTAFMSLTGRVSPLSTSNFAVFAVAGNTGVFGGTRSSDNVQPGYDEGGIGGFFYCDNDRTSPQKGMYGVYIDAIRRAGAGTTHGLELDNINMGSLVSLQPNNLFIDGLTSGGWIAAGGGAPGAGPSSAALTVLGNGARWDKGIIFHDAGLVDRGDGTGEAIAFGYKHYISGYAPGTGNGVVGRISFEGTLVAAGTNLVFDNNGAQFVDITSRSNRLNVNKDGFTFGPQGAQWMSYLSTTGAFILGHPTDPIIFATIGGMALTKATSIGGFNGSQALQVTPITGSVNYIEIAGGSTGNPALVRAIGTDANVGLRLEAQGSGPITIGPVGDPFIFAASTGVAIQQTTSLGGPANGGFAFLATEIPGARNYIEAQGGTEGNAARLRAQGLDAIVDLRLETQGGGLIWLGPQTSSADAAVVGFLTVKDAAGNVRKLAEIA